MQCLHVAPGKLDEGAVLHVDVMSLQVGVLIAEAFPAAMTKEDK